MLSSFNSFKFANGTVVITPFYDKSEPLYELTNFSQHPIAYQSIQYPSTEHAFQAQKFPGREAAYLKAVQDQDPNNTPKTALDLAKAWSKNWSQQEWATWNQRKIKTMENILRQKILTYPSIQSALIQTKNTCLIEDTGRFDEKIWGWGNNGQGENHLGKLWMKIRNELHQKNQNHFWVVDIDALYAQAQRERKLHPVHNNTMANWPEVVPVQIAPIQPNSAIDRVLKAVDAQSISLAEDLKKPSQKVFKFSFKSPIEAKNFSQKWGNSKIGFPPLEGAQTVIIGEEKAKYIFKDLKIEQHGRAHPRPTEVALKWELTRKSESSNVNTTTTTTTSEPKKRKSATLTS